MTRMHYQSAGASKTFRAVTAFDLRPVGAHTELRHFDDTALPMVREAFRNRTEELIHAIRQRAERYDITVDFDETKNLDGPDAEDIPAHIRLPNAVARHGNHSVGISMGALICTKRSRTQFWIRASEKQPVETSWDVFSQLADWTRSEVTTACQSACKAVAWKEFQEEVTLTRHFGFSVAAVTPANAETELAAELLKLRRSEQRASAIVEQYKSIWADMETPRRRELAEIASRPAHLSDEQEWRLIFARASSSQGLFERSQAISIDTNAPVGFLSYRGLTHGPVSDVAEMPDVVVTRVPALGVSSRL